MDELRKKIIEAVTPYAFGDDGELTALSDKDCYQWIDAIAALIDSYAKQKEIKRLERLKGLASIDDNYARMPEYLEAELKALKEAKPEGKPNE